MICHTSSTKHTICTIALLEAAIRPSQKLYLQEASLTIALHSSQEVGSVSNTSNTKRVARKASKSPVKVKLKHVCCLNSTISSLCSRRSSTFLSGKWTVQKNQAPRTHVNLAPAVHLPRSALGRRAQLDLYACKLHVLMYCTCSGSQGQGQGTGRDCRPTPYIARSKPVSYFLRNVWCSWMEVSLSVLHSSLKFGLSFRSADVTPESFFSVAVCSWQALSCR